MAKSGKRPIAVFSMRKLAKLGDFLIKVRGIVLLLGENASLFPSPSPPLNDVNDDVDALEEAQGKAQTRTVGTSTTRDLEYDQVLQDIHGLLNYVQTLADKTSNEAEAKNLITRSGFEIKSRGIRLKVPLKAQNTKLKGIVKLLAKSAGKRASYNWQMSADKGKTWIDLPHTMKATTFVKGLETGAQLEFRCRSVTIEGVSAWCIPVTLVVQ